MPRSLSSFSDNLTEGLHNSKWKYFTSYLGYIKVKDKSLMFKLLKCTKNHKKNFKEDLVKRFANPVFHGGEIRKGIYPYEWMDSWKRFNKTKPPRKKEFYSNLNTEGRFQTF